VKHICKYLGFCESEGIDHAASKQYLITEYSRRMTGVEISSDMHMTMKGESY